MAYGAGQGELAVGGVFLRIFIAQPGWVLRKPREFLVSLLETLTELLEKNNPHVRTRTPPASYILYNDLKYLSIYTSCSFGSGPQNTFTACSFLTLHPLPP